MKTHLALKVLAATQLLALTFATNLTAQNTISWISGVGVDTNPCSRTSPCNTISGALSKTADGGQISALDPADYYSNLSGTPLPPNITQAVTIDGNSVSANLIVATSGGTGITINAGASDTVILRHLVLNGENAGLLGIQFNTGNQLIIEDCEIIDFVGAGIAISTGNTGSVVIKNCAINNTDIGIFINGQSNNVTIENCKFFNCGTGVLIDPSASANVEIRNSSIVTGSSGIVTSESVSTNLTVFNTTVQGMSLIGIAVNLGTVDIVNCYITQNDNGVAGFDSNTINCVNSVFSDNATGINISGDSTLRISNNDFFDNNTPFSYAAATIATANNNRVAPTPTTIVFPNVSIVYE